MRLRQWILSLFLFVISVVFLLFSKTIFQTTGTERKDSLAAMPTTECRAMLLPNKDYYPYLKTYFQRSQKSIVGTVYLVKLAEYANNEPADLLRELIAARKRNVEVDLILERSEDPRDALESNISAAQTLEKAGVRVRFDSGQTATHAKTFVIDGRYCFVGSHNLTHAAMTRNAELSVFIDSAEMGRQITEFIRQIPTSN